MILKELAEAIVLLSECCAFVLRKGKRRGNAATTYS